MCFKKKEICFHKWEFERIIKSKSIRHTIITSMAQYVGVSIIRQPTVTNLEKPNVDEQEKAIYKCSLCFEIKTIV